MLNIVPQAVNGNVAVHTITFGAGADIALMQSVAELTNATHTHADSNKELKEAFKKIAESLSVVMID